MAFPTKRPRNPGFRFSVKYTREGLRITHLSKDVWEVRDLMTGASAYARTRKEALQRLRALI